MPPKGTKESFVLKAEDKHGRGRYDYSNVIYVNSNTKVEIICIVCGKAFLQTPSNHMNRGAGCPGCGVKRRVRSRTHNNVKFKAKAVEVHGEGRYDYRLVEYVNCMSKVEIICNVCRRIFFQTPHNHTDSKRGCPDCGVKRRAQALQHDAVKFKAKAAEVHGEGRYDYRLIVYVNAHVKVEIICTVCNNIFQQTPNHHIDDRNGCPNCGIRRMVQVRRHTDAEFKAKAVEVHGEGRYDYRLVEYVNCATKVEIICTVCEAVFQQTPTNHTDGRNGCPFCRKSKGEAALTRLLTERKLTPTIQQKYPDHLGQKTFDFHVQLSTTQFLLEYDGIQHFEPVEHFGGDPQFIKRQASDLAKTLFAVEHKIPLLRLDHTIPLDNLHLYLDESLSSLQDFDLILSDKYLYQSLVTKVQAELPDTRVLYLGDSTPIPHDSWHPDIIVTVQAQLPEFDLTRSLAEQEADELWPLAVLMGYGDLATERSSVVWLRWTLDGLTTGAVAGLTGALEGGDADLVEYVLQAC